MDRRYLVLKNGQRFIRRRGENNPSGGMVPMKLSKEKKRQRNFGGKPKF
jgi:hypothetical protein